MPTLLAHAQQAYPKNVEMVRQTGGGAVAPELRDLRLARGEDGRVFPVRIGLDVANGPVVGSQASEGDLDAAGRTEPAPGNVVPGRAATSARCSWPGRT